MEAYFQLIKMLAAECYKQRLETGLTFFEMSYMLMQSYDFLHLYETYGCKLEWEETTNGLTSLVVLT